MLIFHFLHRSEKPNICPLAECADRCSNSVK